ncbi:MAG TPA: GAF domain-containing protein, partial [Phycisphaerae bacterium]|nr:GAF domain-containing protein [Phycisphaerae bacterium]
MQGWDAVTEATDHAVRHVRELDALYEISKMFSLGVGQRSTLAEILDILHNDLALKSGTIMLVSPDRSELIVEVGHDLSRREQQKVRYRMGEGISGRVVQTGKPAVVPKVSQEPQFLDRLRRRRKIGKEETSFICVPISIGQEVIGALSVDRIFEESAPLDEDVRFLSIVASTIANDIKVRREAAAARLALEEENLQLRSQLVDTYRPENIIG